MNITVDTLPDCIATLHAEIPADQVQTERKKIVKAYGAQAKIPGFRPGKTPTSVIEKRFADDIKQELESRLINDACDEALKQNQDLRVLNFKAPETATVEENGTFKLVMPIILAPTFELPEYKDLEVTIQSTEATEEDMQREIDGLLQRYADYKEIKDRSLQSDDICVMDFTSTIDGKTLDASKGILAGKEDYWIQLKDEAFLPGFHEQLIGASTGDTCKVTCTLDAEFPVEDIQNKEIVFTVTIKTIKEQELPDFDDKFVAETLQFGDDKTIDDVKDLIKEQIQQQKTQKNNEEKVNQIVENLLGKVDFVLPQELVDGEAQSSLTQMAQRATQQGITDEQMIAQESEMIENAQAQARNNLKTNFILQDIAHEEKITVTDNEVIQRIGQIAQQQKKQPKAMINELQKEGRIPSLRNSILIGKAIHFLVDSAKVTEVEASADA